MRYLYKPLKFAFTRTFQLWIVVRFHSSSWLLAAFTCKKARSKRENHRKTVDIENQNSCDNWPSIVGQVPRNEDSMANKIDKWTWNRPMKNAIRFVDVPILSLSLLQFSRIKQFYRAPFVDFQIVFLFLFIALIKFSSHSSRRFFSDLSSATESRRSPRNIICFVWP